MSPVWTFADAAGTVSTTAWFDEGADEWQRYHRVFDGRGNVTRQGGDSLAALQQIPVVWRGLRQDAVSDLYLVGVTGLDPKSGRYLSQAAPGDSNPYRFEGNRPTSPEPSSVTVTSGEQELGPYSTGLHRAVGEGYRSIFGDQFLIDHPVGTYSAVIAGSVVAAAVAVVAAPAELTFGGAVLLGAEAGLVDYAVTYGTAAAFDQFDFDGQTRLNAPNPLDAAGFALGGAIGGGVFHVGGSVLGAGFRRLAPNFTASAVEYLNRPVSQLLRRPFVSNPQLAALGRGYGLAAEAMIGRGDRAAILWKSRFPGVQTRRVGNSFVKRVDPDAHPLLQAWGARTIRLQAEGLARLQTAGSAVARFGFLKRSGYLATEYVGEPLGRLQYLNPRYYAAAARDAIRLRGLLPDLRPGNYGPEFRAFDPVLDPAIGAIAVGSVGIAGTGVYALYDYYLSEE